MARRLHLAAGAACSCAVENNPCQNLLQTFDREGITLNQKKIVAGQDIHAIECSVFCGRGALGTWRDEMQGRILHHRSSYGCQIKVNVTMHIEPLESRLKMRCSVCRMRGPPRGVRRPLLAGR